MTVCLAYGGSILAPETGGDEAMAEAAQILKAHAETERVVVVVGGGYPARQAIEAARAGASSEEELDLHGIAATRDNATRLATALRELGADVNGLIPETVEEAWALSGRHKITVMGGTTPGHSTDFVATQAVVVFRAKRLIIATSVDGVYSADPRKDPEAKRFDTIDHTKLLEIVGEPGWKAGAIGVIDPKACKLLADAKLEAFVVLGSDAQRVAGALRQETVPGTLITHRNLDDA